MSEFHFEIKGDYNDLLRNGFEFLEAACRCAGTDETGTIHILGGNKPTILPAATAVNSAFACEMFLKALLQKEGTQYPTNKDGHNVVKLFDLLLPETKKRINDFFGYKEKTGQPLFEIFANLHPKDFTEVRYYVTKPGLQGFSPITVYTYAFNLGQITKHLLGNNN